MLPDDKEEDAIPIGELSFQSFYTETGFWIMKRQINQNNKEFVESAIIVDEKSHKYSIQEFLDMLANQNIEVR